MTLSWNDDNNDKRLIETTEIINQLNPYLNSTMDNSILYGYCAIIAMCYYAEITNIDATSGIVMKNAILSWHSQAQCVQK